jgi:integrase
MARPRAIRPALTKAAILAAEPGQTRRYLWDGQTPGLGVVIQPNGNRAFIVQRGTGGRTVRRALGIFPEMTLAEARRLAEEPLATIRAGRNPNEERRAERETVERERRERVTCAELWARYEIEIIAIGNRVSTAREKRRMWLTKIEPIIGKVGVRDVDADHIRQIVHAPMRTDKDGRVTAGKGEAGNLYRLLKHLLRTAIRWRLRPPGADPTIEVDAPRVPRRERLLTDQEVTALLQALETMESEGMPWQVVGAIRMILMSGWRAAEALTIQRPFVDRARCEARLPDTKTGHSVRPLATETLALLDSLPRIVGSAYYFPAVTDARRPLSHSTMAHAFRRLCERAGVQGASAHVVRHRVVTDVAGAAPNVRTGMMLSGHKSVQAFLGYVHAERERASAVADTVTGRISALGRAEKAAVAELPGKRRTRARR